MVNFGKDSGYEPVEEENEDFTKQLEATELANGESFHVDMEEVS